jgi:hypothetical protein
LTGGENFTFDQAMALFYQPSPNPPTPQLMDRAYDPLAEGKQPAPVAGKKP